MRGLFRNLCAVLGTLCVSLLLSFVIGTGPAFAQASQGCTDVGPGLHGTLSAGAAGNKSFTGTFNVGDVVTINWTGMSSILIQLNGANVHTNASPTGQFNVTITTPNSTIRWSALAAGGPGAPGGTVTAQCAGGTTTPPTPPIVTLTGGPAGAYLLQNQAAALADVTGDEQYAQIAHEVGEALGRDCAELSARRDEIQQELTRLRAFGDGLERDALELTLSGVGLVALDDVKRQINANDDAIADLESELRSLEAEINVRCFGNGYMAASSSSVPALSAINDAAGGSSLNAIGWNTVLTPMAFTAFDGGGLFDGLGGFALDEWSIWTRGSITGLNGSGANSFAGVNGRIDFGATRPLGSSFTVGGFIGWDGGTTRNATTGGTTSSNAIHVGAFGSFRLPSDIVLAISGGAAFGTLTSTIGGDSGSTGTQRGFLAASISGTVWEDGPWRLTSTGSVFFGAEQQNGFTTAGGVVVPAQTVTKAGASANATISYVLPTEIPAEVFATLGLGVNGGTVGGGVSGSLGGGINLSLDNLRASLAANVGVGGSMSTWGLAATLGASF